MIKSVHDYQIDDVFKKDAGFCYMIPKYQREYTWGQYQWKDLYDDICENDNTGTDGVVLGTYDPKNQVIYVNSSQFASDSRYGKDSEAIVTACLHEGRHAYQHQVTDGTVLHDNQAEANAWKENLAEGNYISFRDNPRAYYNQPVEVDARRFAEEKYSEIIAERQSHDIESCSGLAPRDVFEQQLSDEGTDEAQRAASFQQTEKETNAISIA